MSTTKPDRPRTFLAIAIALYLAWLASIVFDGRASEPGPFCADPCPVLVAEPGGLR